MNARLGRLAKFLLFGLSLALAAEALATYLFAAGQRRGAYPKATFERLFLARLLYPRLATTSWEKSFHIRQHPGDDQEAYSFWRNFRSDALLGWRPRERAKVIRFGYPSLISPNGFASISDEGAPPVPLEKKKGTFRVIVLGGSTVGGVGATPSGSIPARIDAALADRAGRERVEVINAGSDSFTSSSEFLYLVSELVYYQPDLVIVYDGWNEVDINNRRAAHLGPNWFNLRVRDGYPESRDLDFGFRPSAPARDFARIAAQTMKFQLLVVYEGSAAIQLARALLSRPATPPFLARLEGWLHAIGEPWFSEAEYDPRITTAYSDNLALMAIVAREYGFRIAFFFQPFMGRAKKPLTEQESRFFSQMGPLERENRIRFTEDAEKVFQRLRRDYARSRDAYAEDLTDVFATTREQTYSYTGHLNRAGNQIIANHIVHSLARIGWVPKP